MQTLIPLERVVSSIININKLVFEKNALLTEGAHVFQRLWDLAERQGTEIFHDWVLGELHELLLLGHAIRTG